MKLPRDWAGTDLASRLAHFGYYSTRQKGSHIRLTTKRNGEHHVTIPCHNPLKVGTLAAILDAVARHIGISRDVLLDQIR